MKLLGVDIDNNLSFKGHVDDNVYKKANQKLSALNRISRYLEMERKRLLFRAFIDGQFSYCPMI